MATFVYVGQPQLTAKKETNLPVHNDLPSAFRAEGKGTLSFKLV